MWPSQQSAERIYNVANVLLIAALIVGALATWFVVWMGNVKEEYLQRDLSGAKERTAELEQDAALLRIQLDREIQKRALRALTDEQKKTLVAALRGKIPEINVVVQRDLEAQAFAVQLEIVFQEAGMQLHSYEMQPGEMLFVPVGIMMYMPGGSKDEKEMKDDPLYIALKKANLFGGFMAKPFSSPKLFPGAPMLPPNQHIVYVGQKSPY